MNSLPRGHLKSALSQITNHFCKEVDQQHQMMTYLKICGDPRFFAYIISVYLLLNEISKLSPNPSLQEVKATIREQYQSAKSYISPSTEHIRSDWELALISLEFFVFNETPIYDDPSNTTIADKKGVKQAMYQIKSMDKIVMGDLYRIHLDQYIVGGPLANGHDWWVHPWSNNQTVAAPVFRLSELLPFESGDIHKAGHIFIPPVVTRIQPPAFSLN